MKTRHIVQLRNGTMVHIDNVASGEIRDGFLLLMDGSGFLRGMVNCHDIISVVAEDFPSND